MAQYLNFEGGPMDGTRMLWASYPPRVYEGPLEHPRGDVRLFRYILVGWRMPMDGKPDEYYYVEKEIDG